MLSFSITELNEIKQSIGNMFHNLFRYPSSKEVQQFILDNNIYLVEKLNTLDDWKQLKLHLDLEFLVFVNGRTSFNDHFFAELRYRSVNYLSYDHLFKQTLVNYHSMEQIRLIQPLNRKTKHELYKLIKCWMNKGVYIADRIYISSEDLCQFIENY